MRRDRMQVIIAGPPLSEEARVLALRLIEARNPAGPRQSFRFVETSAIRRIR